MSSLLPVVLFISLFTGIVAGQQPTPSPEPMRPKSPPLFKKDGKRPEDGRSVRGAVTDGVERPLAGAIVEMKDIDSGKTRSTVANSTGQYVFDGLEKDTDYQMRASHKGYATEAKKLTRFDSRQRAIINFSLETEAK